jgi:hypothetical protein
MEYNVEPALTVDQLAVDFDVVAFAGLRAEIRANPAVDGDTAGGDQFVAMPARAEPGCGKKTVQAHWFAPRGLNVRLRLRKAEDLLAVLELAALFQKFDALETFQDVPLRRDGAGSLETAMLRHKIAPVLSGMESAHLTTLCQLFNLFCSRFAVRSVVASAVASGLFALRTAHATNEN